ncbi:MAG: hypothetical protein LBU38_07420, partial [Propionibacteriaceae bacterium]|nr:hypothetical protein [Propionibacteriaceae bacterium]
MSQPTPSRKFAIADTAFAVLSLAFGIAYWDWEIPARGSNLGTFVFLVGVFAIAAAYLAFYKIKQNWTS